MIFPTLKFFLFYAALWPIAWAFVLLGRHRWHKLVIIAGSYFFYSVWSWKLAFLLASSVLINWFFGSQIGRIPPSHTRRIVLAIGVALNLSILGFFKYYSWFAEELNALLRAWQFDRDMPLLEIALPIGISFYTFQGISYIVDLYRGDLDRPRPFIDIMFFISFFPHLVAGPIVRAAKFLPQLDRPPNPERVFVGLGVMLILWGVFKKAVVANYLAVNLVDPVFFDPNAFGTIDLLSATYGYAVQIYCDFSAYSDIAIGIAALLGYRFQRNFNQPYRAQNLADFWRRWHMSLSQWLRDYLYIPLGGNKRGKFRTYVNLLLTMLLGGIWHGAAWKFVIWGALHGSMLAIEKPFTSPSTTAGSRFTARPWHRALGIFFNVHFVCLCWIFFRAASASQAVDFLTGLSKFSMHSKIMTPTLAGLIAFGFGIHFFSPDLLERIDRLFHWLPPWLIGIGSGIALLLFEIIGGDSSAPFIYFQF